MSTAIKSTIAQNTGVRLQTTSNSQVYRIKSVREELDKVYIEAETKAKAEFLQMPYVDLYGFPVDSSHLVTLSKSLVEQTKIGVFSIQNKKINLVTTEPGINGQRQIINSFKENGWDVHVYLCSELSFNNLLERYKFVTEVKIINDDINLTEEKVDRMEKENQSNLKSLETKVSQVNVSDAVEIILIAALQNKASDIHFEPEKTKYKIRLRLDGVLHTFANLPLEKQKAIESRLKILSRVKLNVDNKPQDGRFSFKFEGRDIDVRVSMLPSNYGYSIVMRLLGTGNVNLNLNDLGFSGLAKKRIQRAVEKPQGMILTTGPTGSGKTTTLYTFLQDLNDGEGKIITLEDPIEYKLEGISQTQINAESGYTFSSGLRSILRQDPDVVMVGEIRDRETADIAIQASLTGHKVLSTIHTNDAAGSIPRLMEMDVKGFLLADSLSAVIGQRLVRKICPHCKTIDHLDLDQKKEIVEQLQKIPANSEVQIPRSLTFWTSKGCEQCSDLGYKGRVGIYEVLVITDGLRNLLSTENPSIMQVRQVAAEEGMLTMLQDGILKALEGITDIKEIFKNVA